MKTVLTMQARMNDGHEMRCTFEPCSAGRCMSCGMNGKQVAMTERLDGGRKSGTKVCVPCLEYFQKSGDHKELVRYCSPMGTDTVELLSWDF